jgi:BlaI family transcriptional regulator, penicillinase repressor
VTDMPTPTPRESQILKVLWEQGPLSVRAVFRHLELEKDLAYNTVQTLLRIMEDKGLVAHHAEGRTFVYTP